jgi:hypothetical protein
VGPVSKLVVGVVPVDGTQAAHHLADARQERNLHEEIVGEAAEDPAVKEKNTPDVDEIEKEEPRVGDDKVGIPQNRPWGCLVLVPLGEDPNDGIVKVVGGAVIGGAVGNCGDRFHDQSVLVSVRKVEGFFGWCFFAKVFL